MRCSVPVRGADNGADMPRLLLVLSFAALTACGQASDAINKGVTPAKLQSDTATYFKTSPRNVKIGKMQQSMLGTAYQARVGRVLYNCNQFKAAINCERARY